MHRVTRVFFNGYSVITLLLIFIHQSIVASSAVFLTHAIEDFQGGNVCVGSLLLYFGSMIFPYLPGYLSFVTLQMWGAKSHNDYINNLVDFLSSQEGIFRSKRMRAAVESAAARSSFMVIDDAVSFMHSFASFALNSFLSFLVIGLILPGDIFYGYVVSLALCAVLLIVTRRFIEGASVKSERSFIEYTDVLSRIWPNVVLNNKINLEAWRAGSRESAVVYYGKNISLEVKRQFVNFSLSMLALLPTVYLLWVAIDGGASASLMAVIIVNLTRIFHILGSLSALVSQSLDWSTQWARVKIIFAIFDMPSDAREYEASFKEVTINGSPLDEFDRVARSIAEKNCGRYTIRGENGSGKSMFMLQLKSLLGEKSVYFPSGESGLFWPVQLEQGSTGEQVLHGLRLLVADKAATHLLLDEWDANLDKHHMEIFDEILEKESKTRVVVEVRH